MNKRNSKANLFDAFSCKCQVASIANIFSLSPTFLFLFLAVYCSLSAYAQIECLPSDPVDCSASYLKVAPPVAFYSETFKSACLRHDYCYRFGAATYGYSKKKCDADFYDDMKDICSPDGWGIVLAVGTAGTTVAACETAAAAFYAAVKAKGDDAYKSKEEGSKVCYYEQVIGEKHRRLTPYAEYWILLF